MKFSYSLLKKLLPSAPAKEKLTQAFHMHSFEVESMKGDTIEIKLPPNRYSDAASHIGIAREAAAVLSRKFRDPVARIVNPPANQGFIKVEIEKSKLSPRYIARYFEIKSVAESPVWLKKILETCGLKPINSIVDLMNYAMLEAGQPLHAFDAEKVRGKRIVVRLAKKGEKMETLDGQKFELDPSILVISDGSPPSGKALAIAGVKGGAASGITKKTKRIIVESANFDPVTIYKASKKLKLATDASLRFSHYLSPELAAIGLDRATMLLMKSGAKLMDSVDVYPRPVKEEVIEFSITKYHDLIGRSVAPAKAKEYFRRLGFEVAPKSREGLLVRIPPWRTDVENFEDLAEEVARLQGYESLKTVPPSIALRPALQEDTVIFKDKIRGILKNLQLDEIYGYSFVSQGEAQKENFYGSQPLKLENPMSEAYEYVRPNLSSGISKALESNARFYERIGIFELGKVFGIRQGRREECLALGIGLAEKKNEKAALELKGIVDEFLRGVGLTDYFLKDTKGELRIEADHQVLGVLKPLHNFKKNWMAAIAEIDAEKLLNLVEEIKEFEELPKYPSVMRDISILVSGDVRIGEILETIQETSSKLIQDVDLIDEYVDEKFGRKQSLTFRIVFQAEDRTLTDQEVNKEFSKVQSALKKEFRAEVR